MGTVLVISSQVAASRVGSSAGSFVLRRLGHEAIVLPTVLLGRHPGWGAPGGGAVALPRLRSMWDAVAAQELAIDAVLTGYFADPGQVALAASIIDALSPRLVVCDPVIGDEGGLYVGEDVATAIRDTLVPLAHLITPNMWEFGWLGGEPADAARSARALAPSCLVTSWPDLHRIGALFVDPSTTLRVSHERFTRVPHGGGDTLAALWTAHALNRLAPEENLARSVGSVLGLLRDAREDDRGELMLARDQDHLLHPEVLEVVHV